MPTSERYLASSRQLSPAKERCRVVPLGIDFDETAAAAPSDESVRAWRERLGPAPVVLFVGVLRYYKGLSFLLDAWARLRPDATLALVGDGPLRGELEAQARGLGLSLGLEEGAGDAGSVRFLGRLDDADVAALRALASFAVMPSHLRAEAFGLGQVEAMAAGLPVVACDLDTGVPEVNRHGESGLIVPPADAPALAEAMRALLDDGALRERLGRGARDRARRLYNADRMEAEIAAVYEQALAEGVQ